MLTLCSLPAMLAGMKALYREGCFTPCYAFEGMYTLFRNICASHSSHYRASSSIQGSLNIILNKIPIGSSRRKFVHFLRRKNATISLRIRDNSRQLLRLRCRLGTLGRQYRPTLRLRIGTKHPTRWVNLYEIDLRHLSQGLIVRL